MLILQRIVLYNSAYCEQDSNLQPSAVGRKVKVFLLFIANTSTINFGDTNILLIFFFESNSLKSHSDLYLRTCFIVKILKTSEILKSLKIFLHDCICRPNCASLLAHWSKQLRPKKKWVKKIYTSCLIIAFTWDVWTLIHVRINKNRCRNVTLRHRISFPVSTSEDQDSFKTERSISEHFCAFICQNFLVLFLNLAHWVKTSINHNGNFFLSFFGLTLHLLCKWARGLWLDRLDYF